MNSWLKGKEKQSCYEAPPMRQQRAKIKVLGWCSARGGGLLLFLVTHDLNIGQPHIWPAGCVWEVGGET